MRRLFSSGFEQRDQAKDMQVQPSWFSVSVSQVLSSLTYPLHKLDVPATDQSIVDLLSESALVFHWRL